LVLAGTCRRRPAHGSGDRGGALARQRPGEASVRRSCARLLGCLMAGGAHSGDEVENRADDRGGLRVPEPPHARGKLARLGTVLDEAGDDHTGIGEWKVRPVPRPREAETPRRSDETRYPPLLRASTTVAIPAKEQFARRTSSQPSPQRSSLIGSRRSAFSPYAARTEKIPWSSAKIPCNGPNNSLFRCAGNFPARH
jgi:hypothetical protein